MPRKRDPNAPKRKPGGQTKYTREKADAILERLETGDMLRAICRDLKLTVRTVMQWCEDDRDNFAIRYARARATGWDCIAEELLEIVDDETTDPNSRRVRADTRKWLLCKLHPQKYGERIELGKEGLVTFVEALRQVGSMMKTAEQGMKTIEGYGREMDGEREEGERAVSSPGTHARDAQPLRIPHIIDNDE